MILDKPDHFGRINDVKNGPCNKLSRNQNYSKQTKNVISKCGNFITSALKYKLTCFKPYRTEKCEKLLSQNISDPKINVYR